MKSITDKTGITFWPVGTGDSSTITINSETVMQVDLHQLAAASDDDDPRVSIVDELIELLPKQGEAPFLSTFVLTHPDKDHCLGFTKLLEEVIVGEIWFSPRIFREYSEDLCDDAELFVGEAIRRVEMAKSGEALGDGDRIRIIGYDDLLKEDEFKDLPKELLSVPGHEIFEINGTDRRENFRAFIHGPFKEDIGGERNDTSIALQVTLKSDDNELKALLLGDHCYPTVNKMFEISEASDLRWNVLLAPHHCSKSVMYWKEEGETEATLKQPLLDSIESSALSPSYIISSSSKFRDSDSSGDNPPHLLAREQYELITEGFYCTQETPDTDTPAPFQIVVDENGVSMVSLADEEDQSKSAKSLGSAVIAARGVEAPPTTSVGFGNLK